MSKNVILIGGGGHCRSCIDVIDENGMYTIAGIVDLPERLNEEVSGYRIIGTDQDLQNLVIEYGNILICIGDIQKRKELFNRAKELGANFPIVVSPKAQVSDFAMIDEGSIVFHNASINNNAKIGKNCIINTGAIVEHDCIVDDHCHIAVAGVVNGGCHIQEQSFIGSNATILEGLTIARGSTIGAGGVVTKNVEEPGIYVGVPARKVEFA